MMKMEMVEIVRSIKLTIILLSLLLPRLRAAMPIAIESDIIKLYV